MNSREAFEAHIKSMIESEAGEAQALARGPDDDYTTAWVCLQWWGWQAAIQHARDVAVKVCEEYPQRDPAEDGSGYWAANECADAIKEALK
ncbi:MAG: hypothetical protein LCH79_15500 [Proteobacteria bacterium]|nr:hypothetical protein [Pseudomonadota bacterium]